MTDSETELPDFDIPFEDAPSVSRSPACLLVLLLATPVILGCSLGFLALLAVFSLQIINARP